MNNYVRTEIGDLLPCFKCGKAMTESAGPCGGDGVDSQGNQGIWAVPYKGTEFDTMGHYGSTFWDSFESESITITICDECCKEHIRLMRFRKRVRYGRSIEFTPEEYKELYEWKLGLETGEGTGNG